MRWQRWRVQSCRLLCLLLCLLLASSCAAKPNAELYGAVASAYEASAWQDRAAIGFMMEASFRDPEDGQTGVLYYIKGDAKYDRVESLAWQSYTVTRLAKTETAVEWYRDGAWWNAGTDDEATHLRSASAAEVFQAFPYGRLPLPELSQVKELRAESNATGMLYTLVTAEGQKDLLDRWQLDLYALAGITVPDREKERCGDVTYTLSVSDGQLRSVMIRMEISLFASQGYTPGYTPGDRENRLDLTLVSQITFQQAGDAVEIPEASVS